jgi:hypothetical protein
MGDIHHVVPRQCLVKAGNERKKDTLNSKEITIRIRLSVKFQAPFIINIFYKIYEA